MADWIIYLRQSDFRGDDPGALTARADELRELASTLPGVNVPPENVRVENDIDPRTGRIRGASASKATRRVTTANGHVELRTWRPVFDAVMLDLQHGAARGLLVSDESRIARDHRDGMMLLDACRIGGASCVALDEEGGARWVLTDGGTRTERDRYQDRIEDARRFVADLRAKITKGRRRWAGVSWQGGRRPFGFQIEEGTEEHARNLVKDEAEAAELVLAADLLLAGSTMKGRVADLRERGVPTVTGAPWSTRTLRDALIKPATAGLAVKGGKWVKAPWPAILEREVWDRLRALLLNPDRRTNAGRGNEPRWLVSVFGTCGVCGKPLRVGGAGRGRGSAYVGAECGHIRRDAVKVDKWIGEAAIDLLGRPGILERLRPPTRPGVDVAALHAELDRLGQEAAQHRAANIAGRLTAANLYPLLDGIDQRQTAIHERIAASAAAPDVLAAFHDAPARAVWDDLDMPRRRAVIKRLYGSVVILPAGRGNRFDPTRIKLTPREDLAA